MAEMPPSTNARFHQILERHSRWRSCYCCRRRCENRAGFICAASIGTPGIINYGHYDRGLVCASPARATLKLGSTDGEFFDLRHALRGIRFAEQRDHRHLGFGP
jgi:hypothetical protein